VHERAVCPMSKQCGCWKDEDVSVWMVETTTTSCYLTFSFEIYDWCERSTFYDCRERVQETQESETVVGLQSKVITATSAIITILQYCGLEISQVVLPQYC
jgi:hypothetical protein